VSPQGWPFTVPCPTRQSDEKKGRREKRERGIGAADYSFSLLTPQYLPNDEERKRGKKGKRRGESCSFCVGSPSPLHLGVGQKSKGEGRGKKKREKKRKKKKTFVRTVLPPALAAPLTGHGKQIKERKKGRKKGKGRKGKKGIDVQARHARSAMFVQMTSTHRGGEERGGKKKEEKKGFFTSWR